MSGHPAIPFPDELVHLGQVSTRLSDALQQAGASVKRADREYADTKRYMADYREEIGPHEMFQNELPLKQTDRTDTFVVEMRDRIAKLKDSPYSAGIDFKGRQEEEGQPHYIGRSTFQYENEPLVFDWCAPVSGMFYDYEVGAAGFMASAGWITGEFTRKRQFKIRNGVMEYALESSANVQNDVLQRELGHTSDKEMKSTISTIQGEQDQIIRNGKKGTMVIQGVTGSSKTSIVPHHIVLLLYRLKDRLTARNATILLPDKVFRDYTSGVIPGLGEEPIHEVSFGELAEIQPEGVIDFEPDRDLFGAQDETQNGRIRLKSTLDFASLMDQYIEQLPESILIPTDYMHGNFSAKGKWTRDRFLTYGTCPVKKWLITVADGIHDRFETDNIMEQEVPRPRTILKQFDSMFAVKDTLVVYKDFYRRMGVPEYFTMAIGRTLKRVDVYPLLYLHSAFQGSKESHITRHLMIGEMQGYTLIQHAALDRMSPCRRAILEDFGQSVNPNHLHGLEDLRAIYDRAQFVELNRNYRSTYEIMRFAKKIHHVSTLEPVERRGEPPALIPCLDAADEIRRVREAIRCFGTGENVSLGTILKTDAAIKGTHEVLVGYDGVEESQVGENQMEGNGEEACDIGLLTRESTSF